MSATLCRPAGALVVAREGYIHREASHRRACRCQSSTSGTPTSAKGVSNCDRSLHGSLSPGSLHYAASFIEFGGRKAKLLCLLCFGCRVAKALQRVGRAKFPELR